MPTRLAPLFALALLAAGCAENGASIEPVGLCSPDSNAVTCASSGSCEQFLAGQGFFYLAVDTALGPVANGDLGYFMQFDNQMPDNGNPDVQKANTNDAYLEGVTLAYTVHASALTPAFTLPKTVASTTPTLIRTLSTGTPFVNLIPFGYVPVLAAGIAAGDAVLVDVELRGRGKLLDQSRFETSPMTFPVWVVNDVFPGYTCPTAGDVVTDVCPGSGQAGATFSCGGAVPGAFTLGGTVSGLTGTGLVLGTSGLSDLAVAAGSLTFRFATTLADGASYNVTVVSQPVGQVCTVTGGLGTVSGANVTSVSVRCI